MNDPPSPPAESRPDYLAQANEVAERSNEAQAAPTTPPDGSGTSDAAFSAPFNINEVPEDQRPYVEAYAKQLQGAYTRKTQELAAQRGEYEQARDLYERLHADDEATRDAAVREALATGGWSDLSDNPEEAEDAEEYEDDYEAEQPAPTDPRLDELLRWKSEQEQRDQQAEHNAYLEEFRGRYTTAVEEWSKRNGYGSVEKLPDHLKHQIAGYVRGVPVIEESGYEFPDMATALTLLDADRAAAYLGSKEGGNAPNTAAVTAQPASNRALTDRERLAAANAVAARHVGS